MLKKINSDKEHTPLVSVVIPAYNCQDTINECVNSILNQNKDDVEIIIVDDGSTDATASIVDKVSERSQAVHVLHIENGGPGQARNFGMERARGSILVFLDSDDVLLEGSIDNIVKNFQIYSPDIVALDFTIELPSTERRSSSKLLRCRFPKGKLLTGCAANSALDKGGLANFSWMYAYKMDFIREYNLVFPRDVRVLEDAVFINRAFSCEPKVICATGDPTHLYRMIDGSIVHRPNNRKAMDALASIEMIRDIDKHKSLGYFVDLELFAASLIDYNSADYVNIYDYIKHNVINDLRFSNLHKISLINIIKAIVLVLNLYPIIKRWKQNNV